MPMATGSRPPCARRVSGRRGHLLRLVVLAPFAAAPTAVLAGPGEEGKAGKPAKPAPTYARDVAPILQSHCQNCHRKHQVGPFPLESYEHARKRAGDIAEVAGDRSMPPWKPAPGVGPKLKHDQSLTHAEVETLKAWARAGAPKGDDRDLPPPPTYSKGWKLGPPDLIVQPAEDFHVPATGPDVYRCFVLPTNLTRDGYATVIDFQPGNAKVVHHINAFLDLTGEARKLDADEPGPGYTSVFGPGTSEFEALGLWAAGHEPFHLPEGVGLHLPRGADIVVQVHYHPTGKPEVDRSRVGVYFADRPVKQALHWNGPQNQDFKIPKGKPNVEVKATWYAPVDVELIAVSPHMHALGRDMKLTVTDPSGRKEDLIHIPEWDPDWQGQYHFQHPITVKRGSVVALVAHYDNTDHPRNPHKPPKDVEWGTTTSDEMCDGFLAVVKKGQDLTQPRAVDDLAEIFARQRLRNARRPTGRSIRTGGGVVPR